MALEFEETHARILLVPDKLIPFGHIFQLFFPSLLRSLDLVSCLILIWPSQCFVIVVSDQQRH